MVNDPIADLLTRIRNAAASGHDRVQLPNSKLKVAIAKILAENNFVAGFEVTGEAPRQTLELKLQPPGRLSHLKRLSKPGRRLYARRDEIPAVLSGRGLVIVSTSKGLMTGPEARRQGLGGELLCQVY